MTISKIKDTNNVTHDIYAARATADANGKDISTGYMDLASAQTAAGVKTFSNGIKIGSATLTYSSNALTITF